MASQIITQDQVKDLFEYRDGELFWKIRPAQSVRIGDKAGYVATQGYLTTRIKGKDYLNHRIIFLYHHGYLPEFIDHIDGNKLNNRIENLRKATKAQNSHNTKIHKDSTSGIKGVSWSNRGKKWQVRVSVNSKQKFFGYYNDIELAELVAIEARNRYHGQYARHF